MKNELTIRKKIKKTKKKEKKKKKKQKKKLKKKKRNQKGGKERRLRSASVRTACQSGPISRRLNFLSPAWSPFDEASMRFSPRL